MDTPHAAEVLAAPVRSDADVLARVGAIIGEEARQVPTLWLFFLDRGGMQSNVIVPVDDIPEAPDGDLVSNVCWVISQVMADTAPGGTAIVTLSRPGEPEPDENDLRWLRALQQAAASHETPIRMLCLATPAGVRELGPDAGAQ